MDTKTITAVVSTALVIIQALASFFGVQPIQSQKVTAEREALAAGPDVIAILASSCAVWKVQP
jgi:hypothetical protein